VAFRNVLLSHLSPEDRERLTLERVEMPRRKLLEQRRRGVDHVYFPDSGIASVIADSGGARSVEVAVIGREGMTGLAAALGADRAAHDIVVQIAGTAQRAATGALRAAMTESESLRRALLRYCHVFMLQIEQTALANGRSRIEERLSRWLLMACDRVEDDLLPLTHEALGGMLGVRRSGVTVALSALERAGLIDVRRGAILIRDRKGLEANANRAYGAAEAEMRRLFPDP
jgi:CRP-like cAMP-binding protein